MIILTLLLFGVIVAMGATGVVLDGWSSVTEWTRSRRAARRAALESRMRARSKCGRCGALGAVEFRRRTGALLHELEASDAGQAVTAIADYGRRAARGDVS